MNRFAFVLVLTSFALGPSCAPVPPPATGSALFSGERELAYRSGYHHGFQDGRAGRDDDYERHHDDYTDATEEAFEKGYDLGYETGEDQADADEDDRDRANDLGYEAGRADAENGLSPFYPRHRRLYTPATEFAFRSGYMKGYRAARDE